jgi:hypothetical protein
MPTKDQEVKGYLNESLSRSNKEIRAQRGDAIAEDMELEYKREVEDLEIQVTRLSRGITNMFDFSPTNANSLVMGKDVIAKDIKEAHLAAGLNMRNTKVKLGVAKRAYNFLFGDTYTINDDEK